MEITLEKQSEVNALLKINVSETDYQEKFEKSIKEYSRKAVIKGFRPGKVPAGLIKQRFGKELKIEEINRIVGESVDNYLKENKVNILARPIINREKAELVNWNEPELSFEFELGLSPEFTYKLSKDEVFEKYAVELTEKELDDIIEKMRKQYANQVETDEITSTAYVSGNLKQTEGDYEDETTLPVNQLKEEYRPLFIGKKKDEAIVLENLHSLFEKDNGLKMLTGISDEELANLTGTFTFTPTSIKDEKPAELNNELFDTILGVGKAETEEDFRKQVKEIAEKDYSVTASYMLRREIMQKLVKETEMTFPDEFLKKFILMNNDGKNLSEEEVAKAYENYKDSLKQQLIEAKIADENQVEVEGVEVIERTKNLWRDQFASYGMMSNGDEEFEKRLNIMVTNYLFKDKQGENYRNMFDRIFSEKISEKTETLVTVVEKPVGTEDFDKIIKELNAKEKIESARLSEEAEDLTEAEIIPETEG